jgi:hypothetical protein
VSPFSIGWMIPLDYYSRWISNILYTPEYGLVSRMHCMTSTALKKKDWRVLQNTYRTTNALQRNSRIFLMSNATSI